MCTFILFVDDNFLSGPLMRPPSSSPELKEPASPNDSPTTDSSLDFTSTVMSPIATDQDTSNWEKVRQEVTCAICLELLSDPKSMPCLHTYCKKCLMEALAKRPHDPDLPCDRPAINCPLCKAEVDLSDQGIEALPSNFSASRLVETVNLQDKLSQNEAPKCDGCKEKDGTASCSDCGGFFLCSGCCKVHRNVPATKNHTVLPLEKVMQSKVPLCTTNKFPLCDKHPQELLKLFCKNCEVLVCRDCVLVKHRSHDYSFVDDLVRDERKKLENVTLKELETILTSTNDAIAEVKQMRSKVLSNNGTSVSRLMDTFQEIVDMVNEHKKALLEEIQQMTQDDLCTLQNQQNDLASLKQKIELCRDFTRDALQNGTSSEVMSARKQVLERTKILQELHDSSPLSPITKSISVPFYQLDSMKEEIKRVGTFVDLHQCSIKEIPKSAHKSEKVTLKVILKDTKGQNICNAQSLITAQITTDGPSVSVTPTVNDLGSGEYSVSFIPLEGGSYVVHVKLRGAHISKSPVQFVVSQQTTFISQDDIKSPPPFQDPISTSTPNINHLDTPTTPTACLLNTTTTKVRCPPVAFRRVPSKVVSSKRVMMGKCKVPTKQ